MSVRNESVFSQPLSFKSNWDMVGRGSRLSVITKELIVSLLDYSKGPDGKPGKENGEYYVVMELGDYSLEEFISYRQNIAQPFTIDEVRSILWDVARVVCLLHAQGLAHLDIKPANIMLFNSTFWKLIDFDGCFNASSVVDILESDVAFTPLYCAPEIARSIVKMASEFKVSRLMDVWSIGQIAAELVYMEPLLEKKFTSLYANNDDTKFLKWLANVKEPINLTRIESYDSNLYDLLAHHVLVKEVKKRSTIPDILQHQFFAGFAIVKKTWEMNTSASVKQNLPGRNVRIFPVDPKGITVDPAAPLECDDVAAFMHEGSVEERDDDDEYHNDAISEISPRRSQNVRVWFRAIVCRC